MDGKTEKPKKGENGKDQKKEDEKMVENPKRIETEKTKKRGGENGGKWWKKN